MHIDNNRFPRLPWVILGLGIIFLAIGSYIGLFVAPPEALMGQVQRIMYVHVPTAWNALLAMTFAFVCAIVFLFKSDWKWDARMEAAIEVGVVLAFLLCCQGAIWAKPTWGVWWDWDPRLTTTAVLLFAFLGILALRKFVDDPGAPRHLVGRGHDHRVRRRPDRLLLGALVELAAPVAVQSEHRLASVLAAAAHERVRHPLSDDGVHHAARAGRLDAARTGARASAAVGRKRVRRNDMSGGMITGGWNFVVAAYSLTAIVLAIYGASVIARLRNEINRRNHD